MRTFNTNARLDPPDVSLYEGRGPIVTGNAKQASAVSAVVFASSGMPRMLITSITSLMPEVSAVDSVMCA